MHTDPRPSREEPVRHIPGDEAKEVLDGTALCLSGGGFRAMLFHAGTLWRLSELGLLDRLKRISSVSGGSIAAAKLAVEWPVATDAFEERVVRPLRALASRTVDVSAGVSGLLLPGTTIAERAAGAYRRDLGLAGKTLQDLPDEPRFILNATNLATGVLWRFSKPYMGDYKVGLVMSPTVDLATAVAASAAFPPPMSPLTLRLPATGWDLDGAELAGDARFRERVVLSDGGVYDNLGLETAWKRYRTILVSDAGGTFRPDPSPSSNMGLQMPRVVKAVDAQVRALRRRQVIGSFADGTRDGAFWGIREPIEDPPGALPAPADATLKLADVPTRLARMPDLLQERLVNWGYASCDAAVRKFLDPSLPPPSGFKYPAAGVG
ncbi:MAG TPA: patatin-like phospholipase family protein [Solirubrobacteraceae bacterium]|nr:patatin-like phospholipase family protein [Solirubrobacteraceae bacterium]